MRAAGARSRRESAQHQYLMHFVSQSAWSDEAVLTQVGELVLPTIDAHEPIDAWIIDDPSASSG